MWIYLQLDGHMVSEDGAIILQGYSGKAEGKNNPAMQEIHDIGPIPCGQYAAANPMDTANHGPFAMHLIAAGGNTMFGRDGFMIHGDSVAHPGDASNGCIVMSRADREKFWASEDHEIEVRSGLGG